MKSFQFGLLHSLAALGALSGLTVFAAGCSEAKAGDEIHVAQEPLDLLAECGLVCPGDKDANGVVVGGIADGNASISGVASVDAFFSSVVHFNGACTATAGGIQAQLDGIRADFGLKADADLSASLKAKFDANLEAGYKIKTEPARCQADVEASIDATAKCDATVTPGMATVKCMGTCEAEVGAKLDCGADVEVKCTATAPSIKCEGECKGTCSVEANAMVGCEGTCEGTCDGTCSLKNADGSCNGKCDGMCTGSCKAEMTAAASCSGKCEGECTATAPKAGCDANAKASCEGSATAMASCSGKCDGDFEPPMAKAECQASAKADAKVNVQCTPPSVSIDYTLKAVAAGDVAAQAQFQAALKTFISVRLPALLAATKKADVVIKAGGDLAGAAKVAVKGAVDATLKDSSKLTLKASFGLGCAVAELPKAASSIESSTAMLKASFEASGKVTGALL